MVHNKTMRNNYHSTDRVCLYPMGYLLPILLFHFFVLFFFFFGIPAHGRCPGDLGLYCPNMWRVHDEGMLTPNAPPPPPFARPPAILHRFDRGCLLGNVSRQRNAVGPRGWLLDKPADTIVIPKCAVRVVAQRWGGGGWHNALGVGSVSLWWRLLASGP